MENDLGPAPQASSSIHPWIYAAAIGLAVWFTFAAWTLFDRVGQLGLLLAMVTVLFLMGIGVPLALAHTLRRHQPRSGTRGVGFREWIGHEVQVSQGELKGADVAVDMLLPFTAAAFGLTAIGIVFVVVAGA